MQTFVVYFLISILKALIFLCIDFFVSISDDKHVLQIPGFEWDVEN